MKLVELLKKIPLDLGQGNVSKKTMGKIIATNLLQKTSHKTALDVGCRTGEWSVYLKKMGYTVTSIDIEKEYEECIVVDVNKKLPFPESSFDLIWCTEVIEHLDNPSQVIEEFKRVLKPEGEMIITTPNSYFWLYKAAACFGLTPQKLQRKDHKHFFDQKTITNMFPTASIYGFFPYAIIKFRITKLIGLLSPTFVIYYQHKNTNK